MRSDSDLVIKKGSKPIGDLETWRCLAGPKNPDQWKNGRSAKECAQAWLVNPDCVPEEISQTLRSHPDFGRILPGWSAEPEARVPFDSFKGERANLDMLLTAEDEGGPLVVAVEAKADEPFGKTVENTLREADKRKANNLRSREMDRLEKLAADIFGVPGDRLQEVGKLRYQLLTASAAALAEAQRQSAHRAVVIIHEFVTDQTSDKKCCDNAKDLNAFVCKLSDGVVTTVVEGTVQGPLVRPLTRMLALRAKLRSLAAVLQRDRRRAPLAGQTNIVERKRIAELRVLTTFV